MNTLPTVRVTGGSELSARLRRTLDALDYSTIDDRSDRRADVALVATDSTADIADVVRRLLGGRADRVVVVAEITDPAAFVAAVSAGADGWVLPDIGPAALARTINAVRDGESGFSRLDTVLLVTALRTHRDRVADEVNGLTQRERQIHRALRGGAPVRQVAATLDLSEATVRWHAARIAKKLTGPIPSVPTAAVVASPPAVVDPVRSAGDRPVVVVEAQTRQVAPAVDQLGRAELRVAELVAEGLNNREIAERLFLSRHTVESHLKRAYAKLQIRSRVELTRLLLASAEGRLAS